MLFFILLPQTVKANIVVVQFVSLDYGLLLNLLFIHKPSLVATSAFSRIFHALIFLINPSSKRNVSRHWF